MNHTTIDTIASRKSESLRIVEQIVQECADAKGRGLMVLDMSDISSVADYFVVVSGQSDRQVQGISNRVVDALVQRRIKPLAIEGLDLGRWVLLDFGNVVVHVFYEETRSYYQIESLWANAERLILKESQSGVTLRTKAA